MRARWYLKRHGRTVWLHVDEDVPGHARGIMTPVTDRHEARRLIPEFRAELERRIQAATTTPTTFDPEEAVGRV